MFIGPLIRGLFTLGRSIFKRLKSIRDRIRFRVERSWRVEAAALIDALPAFDDLDEDVLSDLAGRVELVTVRDGQTVFRRGDVADAFYVVRSGHDPHRGRGSGRRRHAILTALGRGDAFGELGLLGSAPRAATARADGEATLFRIDKAAFDRLLADDIDAPDFAPTMQAYAELRSLPAFRTLSTADLALVLDHGSWLNVAPGERLITQGEPGDAFYAIGAGQVDVERDGDRDRDARARPALRRGRVADRRAAQRDGHRAHADARVPAGPRGFIGVVARSLRAARSTGHPTATWSTEEEPMVCWHCRRTAVGSCRFCGRGVCEDHAQEQPYVLELFRGGDMTRALVVEDALFCGACTPRPDPIDLPELDE